MAETKLASLEKSLEKIERLEAKVEAAVQLITDLRARSETLQRNSAVLQERVETLQHRNIALSREVDELKSTREDEGGSRDEIIRRIDRMLEKFGELQI
jgi:FtsZ-binding cell division protein ZapB